METSRRLKIAGRRYVEGNASSPRRSLIETRGLLQIRTQLD